MSKVCPRCGCTDIVQDWYAHDQGICFVCNTCGFVGDAKEFKEQTVFDTVTQSPEVLAPKFVYHVTSFLDGMDKPKKIWYSTLINNQYFNTELEAKRATVAKLKEVAE